MNSNSFSKLIEKAINEIAKVQGLSKEEMNQYFQSNAPIPPNIPLGNGNIVFTTQQGVEAIHELGDLWRSESSDRQRRLNLERTHTLALQVFGEALADGLWDEGFEINKAHQNLRQRLDKRLAAAGHDVVHSFPCHIFEDTHIGVFDVGPVRFWPRLEWLDQVDKTAGKMTEWVDYVRAAWTKGDTQPDEKTLPEYHARSVIDGFGGCPWVAVVTVQGNDIGRSKERGHTAVRLAINALGLVLPRKHALNLRGPGDELRATQTITVTQVPGKDISIGHVLDLPHLSGTPDFAKSFLVGSASYREAAGRIIEVIVAISPVGGTQALQRRWCDALFWFGEARRDAADFMALVRYGMTLDILAKGKRAKGITTLLSALLARQPNEPFLKDGTTLRQTVEKIYNEGRSQLGHGGRDALLEDLPFSREGADQIASIALERYALYLNLYTGADTYEDFLQAIPSVASKLPT